MSRRLRSSGALAPLAAFLVVAACVGEDPTPAGGPGGGDASTNGDGATPPSGGDAGTDGSVATELTVDPKTFDVARGGHVTLALHGAPGAVVAIATQAGKLAGGGAPPAASPITAPASIALDAIGNASVDLLAADNAAQGDVKVTLGIAGNFQEIDGRIIGKPGELDQYFGAGVGYVDVAINAGVTEPTSLVVQPDGKLVVAGTTNSNIFVARLDDKGVLDATFGTGGSVVRGTQQNPQIALLADGSIVFKAERGNQLGPIVWLLSSAGAFSDAWGGTAGYPQSGFSFRGSAVIATGGVIFVGGNEPGSQTNSVVKKYFPDAGLDPTWGTDGTQSTPETNMGAATIGAFAVDSAGHLWATGGAQTTTNPTAYALDLRFNATGGAEIDAPLEKGTGLAIAAQGTKAVIAARDATGTKGFLFRNAGMGVPLDPTFGDASTHYVDLGSTVTSSIAVDGASRILAAGNGRTTYDVLRFDVNGHVDGTFGNLGVASIASGSAVAISVVGSSIYAVGKDDAVTPSKLRLARFWN